MGLEQPSSIVFSIKEAVWLKRGKDIAELYSLALEPEVSIREDDDHVFIRGNLHLFGEFLPKDKESGEYRTDNQLTSEQVSFRSVEEVMMTDEGVGVIRHSFPLDVTIPKERVTSLDEVYVTVDSFDYNLPGNGCIELEASITVAGINDVQSDDEEREQDGYTLTNDLHDSNQAQPDFSHDEHIENERSFRFEQYGEPQSDEVLTGESEYNTSPPDWMKEREQELAQVESEEENEFMDEGEKRNVSEDVNADETDVTDVNDSSWNNVTDETYDDKNADVSREDVSFEGAGQHQQEENDIRRESSLIDEKDENELNVAAGEEENSVLEESRTYSEPQVHFISQKQLTDHLQKYETDSMDDDDEYDEDETENMEENALYLTKMLTKGEEEFSKLKLCIVQEGETLEMIAERYGLSVSQLVRVNELAEEHVEEGQILYIPTEKPPTSQT